MKLKPRTKDRLLTCGTVLVLCAVGLVLPGCATQRSTSPSPSSSTSPYYERCETDMECEMQEAEKTSRRDAQPRWKLWTAIGMGVLVTGYLYAHSQDNGGDQRSTKGFTLDKSIQPIGCVANGCAQ